MPSPELLYQLYRDEFDGAYAEGTLFVLTLHPYLSGHRAPMKHLDEFVAYMKSKPGVVVCDRHADRAVRQDADAAVDRQRHRTVNAAPRRVWDMIGAMDHATVRRLLS
jgi:hypothetical protein